MMESLLRVFMPSGTLPAGSQEWSWGTEGLAIGWGFLLFLVLAAASAFSYLRFTPQLSRAWRNLLILLRIATTAVLFLLLVKPVLHLTTNQTVRQSLLVLLDSSQSMRLQDRRESSQDLKRAALAAGLMDPAGGLAGTLPTQIRPDQLQSSRWELLQRLAANTKLDLWARLQEKMDLIFYRFGRDATSLGPLAPRASGLRLTALEASNFFKSIRPDEPATAIGEALREVLEQSRGQAIGGVFIITDGANNSGVPPVETARLARENNIPLFLYGVGVTTPIDLSLQDFSAPRLAFVKERTDLKVTLRSQGITPRSVVVTLKADGQQVDAQTVEVSKDDDYEVNFHFVPPEVGEIALEASVPVQPGEIARDNNIVTTKLRVVDNKIQVLFIEQVPRWDFRYLLSYLQRNSRLDVHSVVLDAEPNLDKLPDSPFLDKLPDDRAGIFQNEIIILGDVDPNDLGDTRMKLIKEWVSQTSGGIIFLAGPKFDPVAYVGTPLEALLPVVPNTAATQDQQAASAPEPFKLQISPEGVTSPYMRLADDPQENERIWDSFPGVRWTAPVTKAKPGAQVLLTDSRPDQAGPGGPKPVIAIQGYGAGECVFIGTDQTYRWRSDTGEKNYSQIWGALLQSLAQTRLQGASSRIQLKADRNKYFVGTKVVISGRVYDENFAPLKVDSLQGNLKVHPGAGGSADKTIPLDVMAVDGKEGNYRGEFTALTPGQYSYSTLQDPSAVVRLEVVQPNLEQMETAMNRTLLQGMADAAHGHFLREEDLYRLPSMIADHSAVVPLYQTIRLFHSVWWLVLLLILFCLEWLLRRIKQLK
jgi:hypothetical protein